MSWIPFAFFSFFPKKKKFALGWSIKPFFGRQASFSRTSGMAFRAVWNYGCGSASSRSQRRGRYMPSNNMAETSSHGTVTTDVFCYLRYEKDPQTSTTGCFFPLTLCPLGDMFHQPSAKAEDPVLLFRTINAPSSLTKEHVPLPPKEVPIYWQFTYQETKLWLVCVSLFDWRKNIGVEGEDG